MTAERRVRMLPMPAARKDREPEQLPSVLPQRDLGDRAEAASIVMNIVAGVGLLALMGAMLFSYATQGPGAW